MKKSKPEQEHKPKLLKCSCGRYTMQELCPACGSKTKRAEPPKFSPQDRYGKYRRGVLYAEG